MKDLRDATYPRLRRRRGTPPCQINRYDIPFRTLFLTPNPHSFPRNDAR